MRTQRDSQSQLLETDLEQFAIIGFFAPSSPELCNLFTEGHNNVLRQHGFMNLKSREDYWHNMDNCFVLLAMNGEEPVGGFRVESKVDGVPLPSERVLKDIDEDAEKIFEKYPKEKCGEACALWNAKSVAGKNLSVHLSRASIAISPLLGIKYLLSFNGTHTFRLPVDVGSVMMTELGDQGYFDYPTKEFRTAFWVQQDLKALSLASPDARKSMMAVRNTLQLDRVETYNGQKLLIHYDIQL